MIANKNAYGRCGERLVTPTQLAATNARTFDSPESVSEWCLDSGFYPIERELISLHFPPPPARILDIGCGAGRTSAELARLGYRVTGIDLAGNLPLVAKNLTTGANFALMDASDLTL